MKKLLAVFNLLLILVSFNANAEIVTWTFAGTVTRINGPSVIQTGRTPIGIGSPVLGMVSFDRAAAENSMYADGAVGFCYIVGDNVGVHQGSIFHYGYPNVYYFLASQTNSYSIRADLNGIRGGVLDVQLAIPFFTGPIPKRGSSIETGIPGGFRQFYSSIAGGMIVSENVELITLRGYEKRVLQDACGSFCASPSVHELWNPSGTTNNSCKN